MIKLSINKWMSKQQSIKRMKFMKRLVETYDKKFWISSNKKVVLRFASLDKKK